MGGDEVDAGVRFAAIVLVKVGRAGEAIGKVREDAFVAFPEPAHGIAVLAVPLCPDDGELADLIAAFPNVPGLGDQLDVGEDRILVNRFEEGGKLVDVVQLAGEGRG